MNFQEFFQEWHAVEESGSQLLSVCPQASLLRLSRIDCDEERMNFWDQSRRKLKGYVRDVRLLLAKIIDLEGIYVPATGLKFCECFTLVNLQGGDIPAYRKKIGHHLSLVLSVFGDADDDDDDDFFETWPPSPFGSDSTPVPREPDKIAAA